MQKLMVLRQAVDDHVVHEENELFPLAKER
jgi:hypothetical protein